jgi:basic membrane protein A
MRRKKMTCKRLSRIGITVVAVGVFLGACGGPAPTAAPPEPTEVQPVGTEAPVGSEEPAQLEVGMAAILSVGLDNSWDKSLIATYNQFQAESFHGIRFRDIAYAEGVWGDEAERVMREYAETGMYDIIWAHSSYSDYVKRLKDEFPNILFVVTGSGNEAMGDNTIWIMKRVYEPAWLMGMLAGRLTTTNVIGAVGSYPTGVVSSEINAFFEGARSVNPDVEQKVSFIEAWFDPTKAIEGANAQIAAGVDQMFMDAEAFEPCVEHNIICYGPYIDYNVVAPTSVLTSALALWEPDLEYVINLWYDHVTSGEPYFLPKEPIEFGMAAGGSDIAPFHDLQSIIPQDVYDEVMQRRADILAGTFIVPRDVNEPQSD